ncbi:ArsR/SmtB family transcription factor (plasmid) [Streptomyces sp. BI20]|uniref:ArsR/SmtB family transcription factor n=1 Tax=Streptomyces sp. BI20 TaxID=3403460 RepID=UPI003C70D851
MTTTLPVAVTTPTELLSEGDRARLLAPKLRALGDETRLTLMLLIAERPRTVKELQEATGLSQTLVSHHLAPLREQELISSKPRGRSNVYSLCCAELGGPVQLLASLAAQAPEGAASCR